MRSISNPPARMAFQGISATTQSGAAAGTSVVALSFAGLRDGVWSISANDYFTIDSGGVVRTSSTPTVAGTTYKPVVTFVYTQAALSVTARQELAISAVGIPVVTPTPAPAPTPTPSPAPTPAPTPTPTSSASRVAARPAAVATMEPTVVAGPSTNSQLDAGTNGMFAEATLAGDVAWTISSAHRNGVAGGGFRLVAQTNTIAYLYYGNDQFVTSNYGDGSLRHPTTTAGTVVSIGADRNGLQIVWNGVVVFEALRASTGWKVGSRTVADVLDEIADDPLRKFATFKVDFGGDGSTNLRAGQYVTYSPPITLNDDFIVDPSTKRLRGSIVYYSPTTSYVQVQIEDGATVLAPWADMAVISNGIPGQADLESLAVMPASKLGAAFTARVRLAAVSSFERTALVAYAAPARFGMNLASAGTYVGERMFTNLFETREWHAFGDAGKVDNIEQNFRGSKFIGPNYEVKSSPADGLTAFFCRPDAEGRTTIDVTWDGEGVIEGFRQGQEQPPSLIIDNITPVVTTGNSSRRSFDCQHKWDDKADIACTVKSPNPANPVRNIKMIERGNTSTTRITDGFLTRNSIFDGIRTMNLTETNTMLVGVWSERSRLLDEGIGHRYGMCIETQIEMANAMYAKNPKMNVWWINIPTYSGADYITRVINAFDTGAGLDRPGGLHPNIVIYVESGNEPFNSGFYLRQYLINQALANGRATNEEATFGNGETARQIEQAFQYNRMMKIITDNCNLSRVKRVFAHQLRLDDAVVMVNRGLNLDYVDVASSAFYFGNAFNNDASGPYAFTRDYDVLFPRLDTVMDNVFKDTDEVVNFWRTKGKPYRPYEAQQHYIQHDPNSPYYDQAFYEEFQAHPRMFTTFDRFYTKYRAKYGDLIMNFESVGPSDARYGAWGFKRGLSSPLSTSPKQAAVQKHLGLAYT